MTPGIREPASGSPGSAEARRARLVARGALALAFSSLFCAPMAGMACSPPHVFPQWLLVAALAAGAMVLALWASAQAAAPTMSRTRQLAGTAFFPALLACSVPVMSYYTSFHDLPWGFLMPLALLLGLGGWRWGQRWLSLPVMGAAWIWAFGAGVPPGGSGLPRSVTVGDLTATITSLTRSGRVGFCHFDLKSKSGRPLDEQLLINRVGGEGWVSPCWPVGVWPPVAWPKAPGDPKGEAHLTATTFPPWWAGSYDLTLKVRAWPSRPEASLVVPVPPRDLNVARVYSTQMDGTRLAVSEVRWVKSGLQIPPRTVLGIQVSVREPDLGAVGSPEFRVTDEQGRLVPVWYRGYDGDQTSMTQIGEINGLPASIRRLKIDVFSRRQLEAEERVFRFPHLANPAPGP